MVTRCATKKCFAQLWRTSKIWMLITTLKGTAMTEQREREQHSFQLCSFQSEYIEKLNSYGYVVIDNFLPDELHRNLLDEFDSNSSSIHYQIRAGHYGHVFHSPNTQLPDETEAYIARFSILDEREKLPYLNIVFKEYLIPLLKLATNNLAQYALFPNAVRLRSGDVFRTHQDAYLGIIGYSFFINRGWKWDYGGILTYVRDEDIAEPIFPKSNRLLLRNESFKHFHFLNTIEQFALNDQYIVLGWADVKKGESSSARGEYYDF
jgi:hypothetical protein